MTAIKILLFSLLVFFGNMPVANSEGNEDKIFIYHKEKKVCSGRLNKCFPIAIGSNIYPTPMWSGPRFLTTHYKNGFIWQNPITGKQYQPYEHNLGPIWIQVITNNKGWDIGFHSTPDKELPLSEQVSHGCIRMDEKDIREFSKSLKFLDKFYSIK